MAVTLREESKLTHYRVKRTHSEGLTGCGRLLVCTLVERNNDGAPFLSAFSRCQILRSGLRTPSSSYGLQRQYYTMNTSERRSRTRTPRVTRYPRLSTMCVTRPLTCATQLDIDSNSLLSTCTLPCMSATTMPYAEDVTVEIEVATRSKCGLSARSCASLTSTTSKNGNCLHCNILSERNQGVVDDTHSWCKTC